MSKSILVLIGAAALLCWMTAHTRISAAESTTLQRYELVTIRWSGRENTHLIRSNGKVEMLGSILNKVTRPDRVDEKAFYMNIAMNAVAKEGYDFAGMTTDEIVMKRAIQE